jgi:phosphate transport system permease protein
MPARQQLTGARATTGRWGSGHSRGSVANACFLAVVRALTALCLAALVFVVLFVSIEALPTFDEVSLADFLLSGDWMPVDYVGATSFGIANFVAGTLAVSLLALLLATAAGVGAAAFLAAADGRVRAALLPFVDLLAGVPSVVFGFVGIEVVTPAFRRAGVSSGSCVLAAAIVLATMVVPFLVSSVTESLMEQSRRFAASSDALGVSRWHFLACVGIPASWRSILMALVLAAGRAMGETMAVMMVIGDANLFPTLLGKGESIAALIALEMGTAEVGSTHYHALYAAGLVLVVLVALVNLAVWALRRALLKGGE